MLVRQLKDTLAWEIIRARHRLGATLVFASAATISVGAWVLPVYEIYKVGEDVHTKEGLNLFSDFGLDLSFIPHWNNAEGGIDLDTSRCFVGMERFDQWRKLIPAEISYWWAWMNTPASLWIVKTRPVKSAA